MALVTNDANGNVSVKETGDHLGRKGLEIGGGVGLVVGLLAPPLLASVIVGAAAGGLIGKFARHRVESGLEDKMGAALPPGSAGIVAIYDRAKASTVDATLASAVKKSVAQVDGRGAKQLIVTERDYDLVCIGSPTWWLSTDVPIRSFLESDTARQVLRGKPFAAAVPCRRYWRHNLKTVRRLGTKSGGVFADGIHFRYQGGQVRSLLSLISYLGSGENRDRYLGVKIPPTNIQEYHLEAAQKFADGLGDHLLASPGDPETLAVTNSRRRDVEAG